MSTFSAASATSLMLFLTSFSLTFFSIVTPRLEIIEPAHMLSMKMKKIKQTLLNVAMAVVSSLSFPAGTGTSCGTCAPLRNIVKAKIAGVIIKISPTVSSTYPTIFSAFSGFMAKAYVFLPVKAFAVSFPRDKLAVDVFGKS